MGTDCCLSLLVVDGKKKKRSWGLWVVPYIVSCMTSRGASSAQLDFITIMCLYEN